MLQVNPQAIPVWPDVSDAPDLETIVADQADTISAQAALLARYQAAIDAVRHPAPTQVATGTCTASNSTSLTVAAPISGTIHIGSTIVVVAGVPAGTTVLGQISGAVGSTGVYLLSHPVTVNAALLTFTPGTVVGAWPIPTDPATLQLIQLAQAGMIRMQASLSQQYIDLLNLSETPIPV